MKKIKGIDEITNEEINKQGAKDFESQKLTDLEYLIMKPYINGNTITSLTQEELIDYSKIDIDKLHENDISNVLIQICIKTQQYILENLEELLKAINQDKQKDIDENVR